MTEKEAWALCHQIDSENIPIIEKWDKIDATDLGGHEEIAALYDIAYETELNLMELDLIFEDMKHLIGRYFVKKDESEYIAVKDLTDFGLWGKKIKIISGIWGKEFRVSNNQVYRCAQKDGDIVRILNNINDFWKEYKEISEQEFKEVVLETAESVLRNDEPVTKGRIIEDYEIEELIAAKKNGWFKDLDVATATGGSERI